ncbi:cupin [Mycobacterium sp. 852013-50091_SCH5140682]|nr:cupin [Mycobacterium sp. 852013-50091_SCH5140682]
METSVNLRHVDTTTVELSEPQPKPTSRTGQLESAVEVWADSVIDTGVWECDPGEFTADRSAATEVCHIISGSGIVVGDDGTSADIGPGSLLVLPRGWRGTWLVKETIRKTYVIIGA